MVYAPRTQEEVDVLMRIVMAAIWWVGGIDVEKEGSKPSVRDGAVREKETGKSNWLASCNPDSKTVIIT
jgi:hypothetical protein